MILAHNSLYLGIPTFSRNPPPVPGASTPRAEEVGTAAAMLRGEHPSQVADLAAPPLRITNTISFFIQESESPQPRRWSDVPTGLQARLLAYKAELKAVKEANLL